MNKTSAINILLLLSIVGIAGVIAYSTTPTLTQTDALTDEAAIIDHKVGAKTTTEKTAYERTSPATATAAHSEIKTSHLSTKIPVDAHEYVIPIVATGTVLEAMDQYAAADPQFSFSGREFSGLGFFIEAINEKQNANGFYWTLIINDELSEHGASMAEVGPGSTVLWRYQKGL